MFCGSNTRRWSHGLIISLLIQIIIYGPITDTGTGTRCSSKTDLPLIDQCYYAYSTQLLINAARVLNNAEDVHKYSGLLEKIKRAFLDEYMTPDGTVSERDADCVCAGTAIWLIAGSDAWKSARRLSELVRANRQSFKYRFFGNTVFIKCINWFWVHRSRIFPYLNRRPTLRGYILQNGYDNYMGKMGWINSWQ